MKKPCSSGTSFTGLPGLPKHSALQKKSKQYHQLFIKINRTMEKAYLYIRSARVDEGEVKENGPQRQEENLREHCRVHQLKIAGVFSDIASGTTFERPGFKEMLALMEGGKGPSTLLFSTWDRYSRNPAGAIEMLGHLKGLKVKAKALTAPEPFFVKAFKP
jgi:predicted site-specific integrase-resolvase